jgi:enolase
MGDKSPVLKDFSPSRRCQVIKREVWEAFKRVKANQGAAGVDGQSIAEFEADLRNNLYMLVGDEGGYGPRLKANRQALDMLVTAIEACHYRPGEDVAIGLDVAATHLTCSGGYRLPLDGPDKTLSAQAMVDLFDDWTRNYPIVSIEDPLEERDETGWREATQRLGNRVQLIGDDLFVTNPDRFQRLAGAGLANSVLIKINQIGTLSQTFTTMRLALEAGYWPVVSARSGETEDSTIADLAVATGAGQIKIGSVARSERLAKYNQLLRLEERLGSRATWLGGQIFAQLGVP